MKQDKKLEKQKALMGEINALLLLNPDPQSENGERLAKLAAEYLQLLKNELADKLLPEKEKLTLLEIYMEGAPEEEPTVHFEMNTFVVSDLEKVGVLIGQMMVNIIKERAGEDTKGKAALCFATIFNAMMNTVADEKFVGIDFMAIGEPKRRKPKKHLDS